MAGLQQSPLALHTKSHISPMAVACSAPPRSLRLRSISTLPVLRLSRRHRRRRLIATMSAASSYACALADVAQSNGSLDATMSDLEKISPLFHESAFVSFFGNPIVDLQLKRETLDELAASYELLPHTANLLQILVEKNRTSLVQDIFNEFEFEYNRITCTELAVVTSVVPLDSTHLAQIAKTVQRLTSAKNVRIKSEIDPSLVAGFTIRYGPSGSKFIDMSIKRQLDDIKGQLEMEVQLVGG